FTGNHHHFDARIAEIDVFLARDVGEPQGIGGRATQEPGRAGEEEAQALTAAHAAGGDRAQAELLGRVEGGPETEEGAEGKRKEGRIARDGAGVAPDDLPVLEQPLPALGRVEPDEGPAMRAARLVIAR